jgi:hypothetical protein
MGAEAYYGAGVASGASSGGTLAGGATVSAINLAAAPAIEVQNDSNGAQQIGSGAGQPVQLLATSLVPKSTNVGTGTQTVNYFPSTEVAAASSTATSVGLLGTSSSNVGAAVVTSSTSGESVATSSALRTKWFDRVDAVHQRASNSHRHGAGNFLVPERIGARSGNALRLLERAWSNYARGRDEFDALPLSQSTGDDENEAMDLAVAALFAEDAGLLASL